VFADEVVQVVRNSLRAYCTAFIGLPLRLPPEVVLLIAESGPPHVRNAMSHVCSAWRQALLSNPTAWTRIAYTESTYNLPLAIQIDRSARVELDVQLDLRDSNAQSDCRQIIGHMSRVKSLKLHIRLESFSRASDWVHEDACDYYASDLPALRTLYTLLFNTPAPRLRLLGIEDPHSLLAARLDPVVVNTTQTLFDSDAPNLTAFTVNIGLHGFKSMTELRNVRYLKIHPNYRHKEDLDIVKDLCPNLVHLTLMRNGNEELHLPSNLQTLVFVDGTEGNISLSAVPRVESESTRHRIARLPRSVRDRADEILVFNGKRAGRFLKGISGADVRMIIVPDPSGPNCAVVEFEWATLQRWVNKVPAGAWDSEEDDAVLLRETVSEVCVQADAFDEWGWLRDSFGHGFPWTNLVTLNLINDDLVQVGPALVAGSTTTRFPRLQRLNLICRVTKDAPVLESSTILDYAVHIVGSPLSKSLAIAVCNASSMSMAFVTVAGPTIIAVPESEERIEATVRAWQRVKTTRDRFWESHEDMSLGQR